LTKLETSHDIAESLAREALDATNRHSPNRAAVVSAQLDLGAALAAKGDVAGAEEQCRQGLALCQREPRTFPRNEVIVLKRLIDVLEPDASRAAEIRRLREQMDRANTRLHASGFEARK
jgi:hypothetical protein